MPDVSPERTGAQPKAPNPVEAEMRKVSPLDLIIDSDGGPDSYQRIFTKQRIKTLMTEFDPTLAGDLRTIYTSGSPDMDFLASERMLEHRQKIKEL